MPALPRRVTLGMLIFAVVVVAVAGFSGEAAAQVFQGTVLIQGFPPLDATVTVVPEGPALYRISLFGETVDAGLLSATVVGSSVQGSIQTFQPGIQPCFFTGTLNGPTASLTVDPVSCGRSGPVVLTRVA